MQRRMFPLAAAGLDNRLICPVAYISAEFQVLDAGVYLLRDPSRRSEQVNTSPR